MLSKSIRTTREIRINLSNKRKEKYISGNELSKKIGMSISYISAIESNNIKSIRKDIFINLIEILYDVRTVEEVELIYNQIKKEKIIYNQINDYDFEKINSYYCLYDIKVQYNLLIQTLKNNFKASEIIQIINAIVKNPKILNTITK